MLSRSFFVLLLFSFFFTSCNEKIFSSKEQKVLLDVKPGQSFFSIQLNLQKQKLVNYPLIFKVLAKLLSYDKNILPGEYLLSKKLSYLQILKILKKGYRKKISISIPEGFNIFQIAKLMEEKKLSSAKDFLQLTTDVKFIASILKKLKVSHLYSKPIFRLEGYLFPDTYYFYKYNDLKSIIFTLVKNFFSHYKNLNVSKKTKLSFHQIITLASIVEKETGVDKERGLIAGVFLNRLKKRMHLQTDPTILYGMWVNGSTSNNIRRKDILSYTKYNTYKIKALPIGPIANPGLEAIKAVLKPVKSNFLYFVSKNNGTHIFTKTYKEHFKYVKKYQINRK